MRVAVLTVSDTRTEATDTSGRAIRALLEQAGHVVSAAAIVPDDPDAVTGFVLDQLESDTQVVITTGGTGITSRDSTYEAIDALLDKRLDGFGELFRWLSFASIGTSTIQSRATAGVYSRSRVGPILCSF